MEIDQGNVKKHRLVSTAGQFAWEAGIPNRPGLYWIFSNITHADLVALPDRSGFRYRRDRLAGPAVIHKEPCPPDWPKKSPRVGAYCLRTRAATSASIDAFLCKPEGAGGLYCVYNGYVSGDKLRQRANEHLGPADPGTGCLHLCDRFCYQDDLVKKFTWEFRFCEYRDIPGADLKADQGARKRFLTVWEQGVRSGKRWPILCSQ